jgi:hypothetical protein
MTGGATIWARAVVATVTVRAAANRIERDAHLENISNLLLPTVGGEGFRSRERGLKKR